MSRYVRRRMSLFRRIANLSGRPRVEQEIDAELRPHIALGSDDNATQGILPENARRAWLPRFGSPAIVKEQVAPADAALILDGLVRDVRFALRQLGRSPGFAITAIVTLALGIGANVVVFGVLNAVVLHQLEVRDPSRLYQIRHQQWTQGKLLTTSYPAFEDLRRRNTSFTNLAAINGYSHAKLSWRNAVVRVAGDEVSGDYFDLLGVQPEAGRFFHAADEHGPNSAPYVVLSNALWRSTFHADREVVGTIIELNKHPFTVIGVTPARFHGAERFVWPDYWIPMTNEEQVEGGDYLHNRTSVAVTVIGRLRHGVTPQQATEDLNAIAAQLAREYPETDDGQPLRLIHPGLIGDEGDVIRGFLWSVTLLALLVLMAACANLATLFAARGADRSRELALRVALGSGRRRLVRQMFTEAVLISLMGGAAGLAGAALMLGVLNRSSAFAGSLTVHVSARVYLVSLALTLVSALLFGLAPARQAWKSSPLQMMKGGPMGSMQLRGFILQDLLLGAQIAICMLLVMASLVAVRGMVRALHVPLGIRPEGAMLISLDLSDVAQAGPAGLEEGVATIEKQKAMLEAARSIPGVTGVGIVSRTPMTGGIHGIPIFRAGTSVFRLSNSVLASYVFQMSPGYLEAAGTRLLRGRDVVWQDTTDTPYVAIVNETFARRMWGEGPAIGQRFVMSGHLTEVVGVAENGKYHDMQEPPQPVVYLPLSQSESDETVFMVRSKRPPSEMEAALERTLGDIASHVPIEAQSWSDALSGELFPARAAIAILGFMGVLAAMLAVTGIFGMAAYNVSRRMKELGIRMALGARKTRVMKAAVGRPVGLLAVGSVFGLLLSMFTGGFLNRIVYEAEPRDPLVISGAIVTMVLLGVMASWIPAQRALRVDPSRLMRED
jgi:predicted permease